MHIWGTHRVPHYRVPFRAPFNAHPSGVHMHHLRWCIGAGNEPKASGRATRRKKNKSRPIMGAPLGHPYAHPSGGCINGLGALPSPYGPTLRGAHNGPSGLQKIKVTDEGTLCTHRNLGQINREQGVKLRLVFGWAQCALPLPPQTKSKAQQDKL